MTQTRGRSSSLLVLATVCFTGRSLCAQTPSSPQTPPPAPRPTASNTPSLSTASPAQRIVLPNGSVLVRYPDGHGVMHFEGGRREITATGQESTILYSEVQPSYPPALPTQPEVLRWLQTYNQQLLYLIGAAVTDGDTSVRNYQKTERADMSLYEQINRRLICLARLLSR